MHVESSKNDAFLKNLNYLSDVELILKLACILSMLEYVHVLIKITQKKDVFVCDFVESIKLAQQQLYWLYCDPYAKYEDSTFDEFNSIQALTSHTLPLSQLFYLNGGEDVVYLAFSFADFKYLVYQSHVDGGGEKQHVTKDVLNQAISKVKDECKGVV